MINTFAHRQETKRGLKRERIESDMEETQKNRRRRRKKSDEDEDSRQKQNNKQTTIRGNELKMGGSARMAGRDEGREDVPASYMPPGHRCAGGIDRLPAACLWKWGRAAAAVRTQGEEKEEITLRKRSHVVQFKFYPFLSVLLVLFVFAFWWVCVPSRPNSLFTRVFYSFSNTTFSFLHFEKTISFLTNESYNQ